MTETATDAAARAIAPLLKTIADDAGLLTADQLPNGCVVKLGGGQDWVGFDGFHHGLMHLTTGTAGFTHRPLDGERFVWHRGAF